jgi:hypothetical protein
MTSRERILTALRRGQPDRVPMPLRMWKFLRKHCADEPDMLERHLKAQEEFGIDIWHYGLQPLLPCFSPMGKPWRADIEVDLHHEIRNGRNYWERTIHTPDGTLHDSKQALILKEGSGTGPEVVEPLIKDLKRDLPLIRYMQADPEWLNVTGTPEDITTRPGGPTVADAKALEQRLGDRGVIAVSLYSPIDCRDVMKPADFLMLYYDDREAFKEIVAIGAEAMMNETRVILEAGFEVLQTWWFYTSPSAGWSPTIYEEVFLPHLIRHVELVHSHNGIYIYYDDGKMDQFIDMYASAGIDCLMTLAPPPLGDADPARVKQDYGSRVALMGGIDAVNEVYMSNPKAIRDMVRQRMEVYKPGGGYIMDGSNSLVYETPLENVKALADAGLEFGSY